MSEPKYADFQTQLRRCLRAWRPEPVVPPKESSPMLSDPEIQSLPNETRNRIEQLISWSVVMVAKLIATRGHRGLTEAQNRRIARDVQAQAEGLVLGGADDEAAHLAMRAFILASAPSWVEVVS